MPAGPANFHRIAIVGASTLRGKELKLVLEERNFPASESVLLDTSVMAGTLTEAAGEPTFIRALDEDSFDDVRFAFFAGSVAETEAELGRGAARGATVIDLTGVLAGRGKRRVDSVTRCRASAEAGNRVERLAEQNRILVASVSGGDCVHACCGRRNSLAADRSR